ncbi:MAG: hypothetical protein IK005_05170 [Paludibacteraceae bacterium]|nr:hypothetical protein [Paludibacteraceae bacterium]MBR4839850.1 hypothetical protein [Paludibacteraceae bacterium]
MNFKRLSGTIWLCSSFLMLHAQGLDEDMIFDANVTIKGYTLMDNGGIVNKSLSVYTGYMGETPDTEQHIQLSGNETSYGAIIPAIASLSKFGTLMPLNFHSKDFNFIGGSVHMDSTLSVMGECSLQNKLTIFPIKGAPYHVRVSAEDMTPTIYFGGKNMQSIAGKFKASSFSFVGGPVNFDTTVTVRKSFRVYDELFVCPNIEAPLGVSIMSGDNYTPTIMFQGPRNGIERGSIKASTLSIDGKVGIGTNEINEDVQLQVAGKILCKGDIEVASIDASDIKTNDITVKMNDVADYVFEEGYDLKNLSEVEAYVNENKHLPGIPSAAEIEKDGVSLSKMTNLLLEKIEELTLHMIQLEKENKALKAEMESLKK